MGLSGDTPPCNQAMQVWVIIAFLILLSPIGKSNIEYASANYRYNKQHSRWNGVQNQFMCLDYPN
jgi:hypothetical protein